MVAAGDLKGAARGGKLSDVDVLYIRAIDAEGHGIFGFAGGAASVAPDAAGLIDDLSPLHRFGHGEESTTFFSACCRCGRARRVPVAARRRVRAVRVQLRFDALVFRCPY